MRLCDGSLPEESELRLPLPNLFPGVRLDRLGSGMCTEADVDSAAFDFDSLPVEGVTVLRLVGYAIDHPSCSSEVSVDESGPDTIILRLDSVFKACIMTSCGYLM